MIVLIVWLVAHYPLQAAGGVVAGTGLELYVGQMRSERGMFLRMASVFRQRPVFSKLYVVRCVIKDCFDS